MKVVTKKQIAFSHTISYVHRKCCKVPGVYFRLLLIRFFFPKIPRETDCQNKRQKQSLFSAERNFAGEEKNNHYSALVLPCVAFFAPGFFLISSLLFQVLPGNQTPHTKSTKKQTNRDCWLQVVQKHKKLSGKENHSSIFYLLFFVCSKKRDSSSASLKPLSLSIFFCRNNSSRSKHSLSHRTRASTKNSYKLSSLFFSFFFSVRSVCLFRSAAASLNQ